MSKPVDDKSLPIDKARDKAVQAFKDYKINAEMWSDDIETMHIEFSYPRVDGNIKEIKLGLSDVRASDGIKIHYDFERDGYVIMQPYVIKKDMGHYIDAATETWEEVGFFQSWALEHKGTKL